MRRRPGMMARAINSLLAYIDYLLPSKLVSIVLIKEEHIPDAGCKQHSAHYSLNNSHALLLPVN
jgi:hypothetical protein